MNFAVRDIQPNPFRHLERYPIRRDKVDALRESLRSTGFWGNVVCRVVNGKPQIAYGHHRHVALQEEFGAKVEVDLIVRDLTDEDMIKIMARENLDEWGSDAPVEMETIRTIVEAYAQGKVPSLKVPADTNVSQLRYAPSFIKGTRGSTAAPPYTAKALADIAGWTTADGEAKKKVRYILDALALIEEGIVKEKAFEGLTTSQAAALVSTTQASRERTEAAAIQAAKNAKDAKEKAAAAAEQRKVAEEAGRRREAEQAASREARENERRKVAEHAEAEARRTSRQVASQVAGEVGRAFKESNASTDKTKRTTYKQAGLVARKVEGNRKPDAIPMIEKYAADTASALDKFLNPDQDPRVLRLDRLVEHRAGIPAGAKRTLVLTLRRVAKRAADYADKIDRELRADRLLGGK